MIWGFDFGEVTGVSAGTYSDDLPYGVLGTWHVQNGCQGFIDWWRGNELADAMEPNDKVIAERFVLGNNTFKADLSGVPTEGALMALSPAPIIWQTRDRKQKAGMYDRILKQHSLWVEADDVNWTDGRDANDAIIHSLEYLRATNHMPTLRKYFKD
jgi:hypothetical protein